MSGASRETAGSSTFWVSRNPAGNVQHHEYSFSIRDVLAELTTAARKNVLRISLYY
jgi:hypothetical protein